MKGKLFSLVFVGVLFVPGMLIRNADAGVHVGIGINLGPPAYVFSAPPEVVYVPGSSVYYAPDAGMDILFYHGYWYRPHEGRWFRARNYNGPWAFIDGPRVPSAIIGLPPDYRRVAYRERIPYGRLHSNWRHWERDRYWDRDRHERRDYGRHDNGRHDYGKHDNGKHDYGRNDNGRHGGEHHGEKPAERYEHRLRDRNQ